MVTGLWAVGAIAALVANASAEDVTKSDPYPLSTCIVSGGKLGSMGEPVMYDHEGREIRFCCKGCAKAFRKDPAKYLTKIHEALKTGEPQERGRRPISTMDGAAASD